MPITNNSEMLQWLQLYTGLGGWSILLFLVIGTLLTIVVQSSSATMALTLVMCHEGWIPFELAAAMVLGENIGTTITANLAALVANYNAKRAARAHFITQTIGVLWMLLILMPLGREASGRRAPTSQRFRSASGITEVIAILITFWASGSLRLSTILIFLSGHEN